MRDKRNKIPHYQQSRFSVDHERAQPHGLKKLHNVYLRTTDKDRPSIGAGEALRQTAGRRRGAKVDLRAVEFPLSLPLLSDQQRRKTRGAP